ncbi:MAG: hypothetical protein ACLU7V_04110, partial [Anaerovoracaceae bacterium]
HSIHYTMQPYYCQYLNCGTASGSEPSFDLLSVFSRGAFRPTAAEKCFEASDPARETRLLAENRRNSADPAA